MRLVQPPPLTTAIAGAPVAASLQLQIGQVIRGLVLAQIDSAILRLQIPGGTLDIPTSVPLAAGTPVQLSILGTLAQPQFIVTALPTGTAAPTYQPPTNQPLANQPQTYQQAGSLNAPNVQAGLNAEENNPANATSTGTAQASIQVRAIASQPSSSPAAAAALSSADAIVRDAVARQSGAAALYANLETIAAAPNASIPAPVLAAARMLLGLRLDVESGNGVDANDIKSALARSGLVTEVPSGDGSSQQQQQSPYLSAGLASLRQALQDWLDAQPDSPATRSLAQAPSGQSPLSSAAGSLPESDPAGAQPSAPASAPSSISRIAASVLGEDLINLLNSQSTGSPTPAALGQPSIPRAVISMLSQGLNNPIQSEPGSTAVQTALQASPGALAALRSAVPMPPYRDAPTVPQAPALPSISSATPPREIALRLLDQTDGAIARQTLLQIASLPAGQAMTGAAHNAPDATRLIFDIPLATSRGTAVAQIRIERDGSKNGGTSQSGPVWRASFSIDLEPIGPVHVRIAQMGERTTVTLNAERSESAARLSEGLPLLEAGLRDAELEPGELRCFSSAPTAPSGPPGMFVDHAT